MTTHQAVETRNKVTLPVYFYTVHSLMFQRWKLTKFVGQLQAKWLSDLFSGDRYVSLPAAKIRNFESHVITFCREPIKMHI